MATSLASIASKLSKIQLPSGTQYRITDKDLREMVNARTFTEGVAYHKDEIIYEASTDSIYRVTADFTGGASLDPTKVSETQITKEIEDRYNEIKSLIAGGVHYRGKTSTPLTDGCSTNPIIINGQSYTAQAGDIVIYPFSDDLDQTQDLEFIFDGTIWNELGSTGIIRAMAFADTASGTYTLPTGQGSTTINVYELTGNNSAATTVTGATDVEYVNGLTGTYQFTTNGIQAVAMTDDGTDSASIAVVKGITGTQTFNTDAINDVAFVDNAATGAGVVNVVKGITGTQTFVTSAIDSVSLTSSATTNTVVTGLTGTTSFAPTAETTTYDAGEECLVFTTVTNATFGVNTTDLGVTTTAAQTGSFAIETKNVGLKTTAAATASFEVTTKNLGLHPTASDTASFEVTTKHIHFTPSTTVTGVTVNTTTATVTVYPDPIPAPTVSGE